MHTFGGKITYSSRELGHCSFGSWDQHRKHSDLGIGFLGLYGANGPSNCTIPFLLPDIRTPGNLYRKVRQKRAFPLSPVLYPALSGDLPVILQQSCEHGPFFKAEAIGLEHGLHGPKAGPVRPINSKTGIPRHSRPTMAYS
jgi:hypothetical protein